MLPKPVTGFDTATGDLVTNDTVWRTAKFEHVFWLSQGGHEFGAKFEESLTGADDCEELTEEFGEDLFRDIHAYAHTDVDAILSGEVVESKDTKEDNKSITESCRRTVSRGKSLIDNDLFVDFE